MTCTVGEGDRSSIVTVGDVTFLKDGIGIGIDICVEGEDASDDVDIEVAANAGEDDLGYVVTHGKGLKLVSVSMLKVKAQMMEALEELLT